ncbi:MAG: PP2C family protein-serine/threonine phosphatase [Endomicrobiales bacterium]
MAQAAAVRELLAVQAYGLTDIGLNREKNEDFFVFDEVRGIFIVADGLGGHAHGEVASRLASEELLEFFQKLYAKDRFRSLDEKMIGRALRRAHAAILRQSSDMPGGRNMGTTVVLALFQDPGSFWFANVGDSRGYLLRDGALRQLTKDHSLVAEYRESGMVPPGEEELLFSRSIVTQALGVELRGAYTTRIEAKEGDSLLLCSDGLWDVVPDETIAMILRAEPDVRQKCRTLVETALRANGEDNITVEVVEVLAAS